MCRVLCKNTCVHSVQKVDKHRISIVAIPAIGANPEQVWERNGNCWLQRLQQEIPDSNLLLYDHLTKPEREHVELASSPGQSQNPVTNGALDMLASLKLEDWASRFLNAWKRQQLANAVSPTAHFNTA